ncbi:Ent-copalyl diphosphate synthase 1, chloroplastic [Hordeum vulgare]|nr:Ent-copalyl diphosphate synthase 1, chloroplastic [Hordeum vulgare]
MRSLALSIESFVKFVWQFVVIYGTSYNEHKMEFIAELHEVTSNSSYPIILGGDFNLIRSDSNKSSGNVNHSVTFLFNDWINKWGLMEINIANRKYSWCNNQDNPIFATIDRVFVSPSWDALFPLSVLRALRRIGSDHTPLLLDTVARRITSPKLFRFEKWWLEKTDFKSFVESVWKAPILGRDAIDVWITKAKRLRKKIKGWSANIKAAIKKKKWDLVQEFDILDIFAETDRVTDDDKAHMRDIKNELESIMRKEDTTLW